MVTNNLGVEAFGGGLVVRSQGPHVVGDGRGAGRHAPRMADRAGGALGSAHTDAELVLLLSAARERLWPGQDGLDLGDLASVAPRMDDVADWTTSRRAGQATLEDAVPAASAGGRPVSVSAGGRVVATFSQLPKRTCANCAAAASA